MLETVVLSCFSGISRFCYFLLSLVVLELMGVSRRLEEVSSGVQGGPSMSGEAQSSRIVAGELWERAR